ncbi:MAG: M67 family metallopeptidase [Bryobacteraceae bacterium]
MIQIEPDPWRVMLAHARASYPDECCGAMLGRVVEASKLVTAVLALENVFPGPRRERYQLRPEDLPEAEREARLQGLKLIGIYHSHPDREAYFSLVDLQNSCPWYSFLVLSIRRGEFDHARCWRPDAGQTRAEEEELATPEGLPPRPFPGPEVPNPLY